MLKTLPNFFIDNSPLVVNTCEVKYIVITNDFTIKIVFKGRDSAMTSQAAATLQKATNQLNKYLEVIGAK